MQAQRRTYATGKDIRFGAEARNHIMRGVDKIADAVQVTLGPKVQFISQFTRKTVGCSFLLCREETLPLNNLMALPKLQRMVLLSQRLLSLRIVTRTLVLN